MLIVRYLDWMETAPTQARADSVPALVRSYFSGHMSEDELDVAEAALTLLLDDPAIEVRRALAEALAVQEDAPRHLVVALAGDLPVVSEPIYRRSPCLLDGELIEAVAERGPGVQAAIARRPWVSEAVSQAIAAEGDLTAVVTLLRNAGADLDETAYRLTATRFGAEPDVRDLLLARPDLPVAIRQSLIATLASALTRFLNEKAWMPERRVANVVREACDRATVDLARVVAEDELMQLVRHLRASGQLTTALLIRSLCEGHIAFLEAALAELSGMPADRVYAVLSEGREVALRALFGKSGLPARTHDAFIVALVTWREGLAEGASVSRARQGRRMIDRILSRYQGVAGPETDDLVAMLRRLGAEAAREAARDVVREARGTGVLAISAAAA